MPLSAPFPLAQPARRPAPGIGTALLRHAEGDACCAPRPAIPAPKARPQRATLADLDLHLHCSIVGTCLTTGELRKLVPRFAPHIDRKGASDLEIHHAAVELCCEGGPGRKEINKALDTRHALAIRKFKAAGDEDALRALWQAAMAGGDIPGAYWALMTHPALSPDVRALAFGDVHMLSHLVGASNRADIRRLVALEQECQALREQNERQQARLQDLGLRHADTVRELEAQLRSLHARPLPDADGRENELANLRAELASRDALLALHVQRCAAAEQRLAASQEAEKALVADLERARKEGAGARAEALAAEEALAAVLGDEQIEAALPRLDGACIAYVGGRPGATAALSRLVRAAGGELLLHDGGIEERKGTLAALLARADAVVFPVDYVSHSAMHMVKRVCDQSGIAYHPLRSAGIASFAALLRELFGAGRALPGAPRSPFCVRHG
nr:DUF2325 domain-containing protein [uncultured Massilia sp.]